MLLTFLIAGLSSLAAFYCLRGFDKRYTVETWLVAALSVTILYGTLSLVFYVMDTTGMARGRKIQKDACLGPEDYSRLAIRVTAVMFLVVWPSLYVFWVVLMPLRRRQGRNAPTESSLAAFLAAAAFSAAVHEIASWCIHRGLHWPWWYDNVHRHHHMHVAPTAMSSIDAHPIEVVFWDLVPIMIGPWILGAGTSFSLTMALASIFVTVVAHCGYDFGLQEMWLFHDLHHERMKCNYGDGLFMDRLFGTALVREPGRVYPRWDRVAKTLEDSHDLACEAVDESSGAFSAKAAEAAEDLAGFRPHVAWRMRRAMNSLRGRAYC